MAGMGGFGGGGGGGSDHYNPFDTDDRTIRQGMMKMPAMASRAKSPAERITENHQWRIDHFAALHKKLAQTIDSAKAEGARRVSVQSGLLQIVGSTGSPRDFCASSETVSSAERCLKMVQAYVANEQKSKREVARLLEEMRSPLPPADAHRAPGYLEMQDMVYVLCVLHAQQVFGVSSRRAVQPRRGLCRKRCLNFFAWRRP